ncbi:MAG: hypothetical protein JWO96_562 [Candidatus Saccharibacteria bacterium]|nr:hypothetical protein [Candidatus Saccharibacteria bacterium]
MSRTSWLKILAGGVISFILLERVLVATGNIDYVPSLLVVGTVTVPLAFCAFLYTRARQPDVRLTTLGLCAVWGGVLGTVIAGFLEYHTLLSLGSIPTLAIGLIEETAKLLVPAYFILTRPYKNESDGIILGAAAGAGFAVLESMGYGLVALLISQGNITATFQTLLFRAMMAPAAHIAWSGLLGGALWRAKYSPEGGRLRQFFFTFAGVVLLHALWDSVTFILGYVVLGIVSLSWLIRRVHHAAGRTAARRLNVRSIKTHSLL